MLQVTRGAQFPMVTVRTRLPESASTSAAIQADLEIQFAGQTAQYKQVPFQLITQGNQIRITGTVSGHAHRLQNRPAVATHDSGKKRNSRARGPNLETAIILA